MFKNKKIASALLLTTFVAASVATTALAAGSGELRKFPAMTGTAARCRYRIRIGRKDREHASRRSRELKESKAVRKDGLFHFVAHSRCRDVSPFTV